MPEVSSGKGCYLRTGAERTRRARSGTGCLAVRGVLLGNVNILSFVDATRKKHYAEYDHKYRENDGTDHIRRTRVRRTLEHVE